MVSKTVFFFKSFKSVAPEYLEKNLNLMTKQQHEIQSSKGGFFKIKIYVFFFLYCINKWKKLDPKIQSIKSCNLFKCEILSFLKMKEISIFTVHVLDGITEIR